MPAQRGNGFTQKTIARFPMNKELLHILACPRCRGSLELVEEQGTARGLACRTCAVLYPIRDDIPVMLVEEAEPLAPASEEKGTPSCGCS